MKYTFLFGAGAEGGGQLGMPTGEQFKFDILRAKDVNKFAMSFIGSEKYNFDNQMMFSCNNTSVLYQTIREMEETIKIEDNNEEIGRKQILEELFDKKDIEAVNDYLDYKHGMYDKCDGEERINIANKFRNIYYESFYKELKDIKNTNELENNPRLHTFLKFAGVYSYYDSLFNYLRKPNLYKREVSKLIRLYYAALSSMCEALYEKTGKKTNNKFVFNGTEHDRKKLFACICDMQKSIIEEFDTKSEKKKKDIYYYMVKKFSDNRKDVDINIVTTNYTMFAEEISGVSEDNVSYLHGKLGLFESVKDKRIDTLDNFNNNEDIFPYLLVQSGIKPIINYTQLKELYKGSNALIEADVVMILGYGLNTDDEHIVNVLRERLRAKDINKRRILYFIHVGESEEHSKYDDEKGRIENILGDISDVRFLKTTDFRKCMEDKDFFERYTR